MTRAGATTIDHQVQEIVGEIGFLQERFFKRATADLVQLAHETADTVRNEGHVLVFGTGTSGLVAQALALGLSFRLSLNRPAVPALALGGDGALVSALAEDLAVEEMFARQIDALGRKGDLAIAISADGNSAASLRGLVRAKENGLRTAALLGKDGGRLKNYAGTSLVVESGRVARVHEIHLTCAHILAQLVERLLFPL